MARDLKYQTLLNVLDRIRHEAPPENKRYYPKNGDLDGLNQARSRAYIHLYLKVTYGLLDFVERERWITDGPSDGGIDAYHIDKSNRCIDFIQSKFRTTADNFEEKEIAYDELLAMDVDRITEGETTNENGNKYNGKIQGLLRDLQEIGDIARYDYRVIILANLKESKKSSLRKLTGGVAPATVYDHRHAYAELVFPVVSGTYFNQSTLCIEFDISHASTASARLSYGVSTESKECDISLVFVPTLEIGRMIYQYKNSVLKFNPRSYLELSKNSVNREIAATITGKTTNEFALFNNGITMLSEETGFNERVGKKDKAQAVVTNPQILNGGQTAFTLGRLYEQVLSGEKREDIFKNKEVLLKIITFESQKGDADARLRLVEDISRATNSQSPVTEADRRANDKIQVDTQRALFERYGYYYERKRGEFADGIKDGYVDKSLMIDRVDFLRVCMACDERPSEARSNSENVIFRASNFAKTLNTTDRLDEYFLSYQCLARLNELEGVWRRDKQDPWALQQFGLALRYGKFAVVSVCSRYWEEFAAGDAASLLNGVLSQWTDFELWARDQKSNAAYFGKYKDPDTGEMVQELNYDGYYKGSSLNADLKKFEFETPPVGIAEGGVAGLA